MNAPYNYATEACCLDCTCILRY